MLNKPDVNISTIEDPVEYKIPCVNQTQTNAKAGMTFANGLRALLRQDPNIIMVGEIRGGETANLGVQAALTGHLVFSTLHTNNAATCLPRLLDMGIEPFLIASTVKAVVGQRLVRRLCMNCRQQYAPRQSPAWDRPPAPHCPLEPIPPRSPPPPGPPTQAWPLQAVEPSPDRHPPRSQDRMLRRQARAQRPKPWKADGAFAKNDCFSIQNISSYRSIWNR